MISLKLVSRQTTKYSYNHIFTYKPGQWCLTANNPLGDKIPYNLEHSSS